MRLMTLASTAENMQIAVERMVEMRMLRAVIQANKVCNSVDDEV